VVDLHSFNLTKKAKRKREGKMRLKALALKKKIVYIKDLPAWSPLFTAQS
jgi:hypothetical protein